MEVVRRVCPRFFEQLWVYPRFAVRAESRPGFREPGSTFETWQQLSDTDQQLTPCLLAWARAFHAEEETWILERSTADAVAVAPGSGVAEVAEYKEFTHARVGSYGSGGWMR